LIDDCCALADKSSRNLTQAILAAASHLHWNVTYTEEQVGKDFTERFGWFDVIAPRGPFVFSGVRVMVGYWGDGLDYQLHWHDPAEVYVPIAGSGLFWSETTDERIVGVGGAVFNAPNEKHWTKMTQGPLLALAIWRGQDTSINPIITDRNSDRIFQVKEAS
jgi:mannose-6-phosphate isomerase-like protein (cupin superfamily)